jgi:hypothetical protein
MSASIASHTQAMHQVMSSCVNIPEQGLTIMPTSKWNGEQDYKFKIRGRSDSDYAKDTEVRKGVNGWLVYLCGTVVTVKSKMMDVTALSVTEAELSAAVLCVQDMMFVKSIIESLDLHVRLPIEIELNNKGALDYINGWSVGGQMQHVQT